MKTSLSAVPLLCIPIGLLAGLSLGLAYFKMLRSSVLRYGESSRTGGLLVLSLGRITLAVAAFAALSTLGAPALLSGLVGFICIRHLAVRRAREWL
jgi:F1F0 ATPase subunit 2